MCNIYEDLLAEKESDIDNIILKKETPYKRELMERVNEIAGEYVTELLGAFRKVGIDFRTTLQYSQGAALFYYQSSFVKHGSGIRGNMLLSCNIFRNSRIHIFN